jgi:hypothetical protein
LSTVGPIDDLRGVRQDRTGFHLDVEGAQPSGDLFRFDAEDVAQIQLVDALFERRADHQEQVDSPLRRQRPPRRGAVFVFDQLHRPDLFRLGNDLSRED